MNHKKIFLAALLCMINFQAQAFNIFDALYIASTFIGLPNPTEIIDGIEYQIIHSYQVKRLISKVKNFPIKTIEYKKFMTKKGIIATQHVIDGTIFTVKNINYFVRSLIHNSEKIYETRKTSLAQQQIVIDSDEAIAIMNDVRFLTFTKLEMIPGTSTEIGKYSGLVATGSYFTANNINYIVQ